jgi:exopolysaccharide biosynthesis polyprenyl glycosylphosphotransferase
MIVERELGTVDGQFRQEVDSYQNAASSLHLEGECEDHVKPIVVDDTQGCDDLTQSVGLLGPGQLKARLAIADAAAVAIGFAFAFEVQRAVHPVPGYIVMEHAVLVVASVPGFAAGALMNHLYQARANERRSQEASNVIRTVALGMLWLVAISVAVKYEDLSRLWVLLAGIGVLVALMAERHWTRKVFADLRRTQRTVRKIAIVGTDPHAIGLLHTYQRNPHLGYQVVGFFGDDDLGEREGVRVLGSFDDLPHALAKLEVVGVVVSPNAISQEKVNTITRRLTDSGYHVALSSTLRDIDISRLRPQGLDGRTLLYVEPVIRTGWRVAAKRAFDVVLASIGLVLSAPIVVLAAVAIRFESGGPVFFHQRRVGRDGVPFMMTKLRTMVVDAEDRRADLQSQNEADGPLFKIKDDPRITRVGRILRKLSIDELPQLMCVLRGTMSIVGPRPALESEVAKWDAALSERLRVLPGLTGLWQVSGRSSSSFEDYRRLDLYYVDNWSLGHDVTICLRTMGVVLSGRGAS